MQVACEHQAEARRKQDVAVLGAFAPIDEDLAGLEIHIADLDVHEHAHPPLPYALLEETYAAGTQEGTTTRYSPAQCCGTRTQKVMGNPDDAHISTSYAERMISQIRMDMRRFTRLTNAHSKKVANHCHALSLYFMYYNFARIHSTLRVTPAMQAGVANLRMVTGINR